MPYGWYVIFARDLFSRFSQVKSHSRKLKPQKLKPRKFCRPRASKRQSSAYLLGTIYIAANRTVSASIPLMAIAEAIQEIEMLRSTGAQTRQRKAESGSNHYYERPGYEATFLAALEQRAEIAISFCKRF